MHVFLQEPKPFSEAPPPSHQVAASSNPWYVLATIFNKKDEENSHPELHARNRRIWNAWSCSGLQEKEREVLAGKLKINPSQLDRWTDEEERVVKHYFAEAELAIPSPAHDIKMSNLLFSRCLETSGFIFSQNISFEGSYFTSTPKFSHAIFSRGVSFVDATFMDGAHFNDVIFAERLDLSQVQCYGSVSFNRAFFESTVGVSKTYFSSGKNGRHSGGIHFSECEFQEPIYFVGGAAVSARFRKCQFMRSPIFGEDSHSNIIHPFHIVKLFEMVNCICLEDFELDGVVFSGVAGFSRTRFRSFSYFEKAEFRDRANFSNCEFGAPTIFRGARFLESFPVFSGAIMHSVTTFAADNNLWPHENGRDPESDRESLALIRHAVGKQGLPDEEHYFYRREMACAARIGPIWQRLPYLVFGLLSDYGYSIKKPVIGPSAVFWIGFVLYALWLTWSASDSLVSSPGLAGMGLSFSQIFAFLGLTRSMFGEGFVSNLPAFLKFIAAAQAVLGVVLLFLLGLGLRNRFRLK